MTRNLFEEDLRYCPACRDYKRFLRSPTDCYCTDCGGVTIIFSPEDQAVLKKAERVDRKSSSWNDDRDVDQPRAI